MIYRIRRSSKKHKAREIKTLRRAGKDSPRRLYGYRLDEIDLSTLFELRKLERAKRAPKKKIRIATKVRGVFRSVSSAARRLLDIARSGFFRLAHKIEKLLDARKRKKDKPWVLPALSGALVGVLVVSSLSAFAVLYKLFISNFFGRYESVSVPQMIGKQYESARASLDEEYFNIRVSFEYSNDVPFGVVMAQSPAPLATRKIYASGELPTLAIVVSRGKQMLTMSDYVGKSGRDARLELKNNGITVKVSESYSDTLPRGTVISTSPAAGESFAVDETVELSVSLGKKIYYASVPNVIGLTENRAAALISAAGLHTGSVSYKTSSSKAGTVISQDKEPYSSVQYGSSLSLVISAGEAFYEKKMPSLYGLTLDEARARLAEYGLIVGDIYAVDSSEPSGRVISQSPPADSDITTSTIRVDLYVSS